MKKASDSWNEWIKMFDVAAYHLTKAYWFVSNQGIKSLDKIDNLMSANTRLPEDVMQTSIAIVTGNAF